MRADMWTVLAAISLALFALWVVVEVTMRDRDDDQ